MEIINRGKYWTTFFLLIIFFSVINAQYNEKYNKIFPVDESFKDKTFVIFKEDFLKAIKQKRFAFLIEHLDEKVISSFGGDGGINEFIEWYDIYNPKAEIWNDLETIINMGGNFLIIDSEMVFVAPYISSAFPEKLYENGAYFYECIIDSSAYLYKKPSSTSKVIKSLCYDILKIDYDWRDSLRKKVETFDNVIGYVRSNHLRSSSDYRIGFVKRNNIWKIIWFVAGD